MGYWGKVTAAALIAAFASGLSMAGEPLVVTRLPDPETRLLTLEGVPANPSAEQRNAEFIQALAAATAAREQNLNAQCRAANAIPVSGEARMSWEANCRYRRR